MVYFLDQKVWDNNHSSVWKEIVSRFGQADYDDASKRAEHETTLEAEWIAQEYARNRQAEYPSVGDQLDMLMKDMKNGTKTHQTACEAVKSKYKKPE